jgi:arginine deiminase
MFSSTGITVTQGMNFLFNSRVLFTEIAISEMQHFPNFIVFQYFNIIDKDNVTTTKSVLEVEKDNKIFISIDKYDDLLFL